MRILLTGICGYVGSRLALRLAETLPGVALMGLDNLSRRGTETNVRPLMQRGVRLVHGDVRLSSDFRALPDADWVIDCAADPRVLAGIVSHSGCSAEQLTEHNLVGTLHVLEYCRQRRAGLVLLSSSRVYSIDALTQLPLRETATRLKPASDLKVFPPGFSVDGIAEDFSTTAPVSLYGATKLASEAMALEYGSAFGLPVWVNRCGVIGGPGQFGQIDQGVFAYWVYSAILGRPLSYIGFGGTGKQVRDCVTAEDLADLVVAQLQAPSRNVPRVLNVGGGNAGAASLLELTRICETNIGRAISVAKAEEPRPYDIPYYVTDTRLVQRCWGWRPTQNAEQIIGNLCGWAVDHRDLIRGLYS